MHGGYQTVYAFDNGFDASVIQHRYSRGSDDGLFEVAMVNRNGNLDYSYPMDGDVIGRLTDKEVGEILEEIKNKQGENNE